MLTKLQIEMRIATIKMDMDLIKVNYSKLEGHLTEANHWLSEFNKKEAEAEAESDAAAKPIEDPVCEPAGELATH